MKMSIVIMMCFSCLFVETAHAQDNLVGSWKIDIDKLLNVLKSDTAFENLPSQLRQSVENDIQSREFSFDLPDVVYITFLSKNNVTKMEGRWSYNVSNKELQIIADGRTKKYRVQWDGNNAMQWIPTAVSNKEIFKVLYFKRQ